MAELLAAWIGFPLLLAALATGCGLLVEALSGRRLATALLPAAGFALLVVAGQFLTLADATAELTAPAAVVLAAAGLALGLRGRGRPARGWGWAVTAAAGAFAAYALPIVASGEAGFAGYIRLDDTATWMALTDRLLEHGRDLGGLAPSSYEATLAFNLADGYPVGAFVAPGIGTVLGGQDVAWLIQPYMAWLAALLALALWSLARPLVAATPARAVVAFVAAQPALLFGYALWGGVKEVAAAALVAAVAALLVEARRALFEPRALVAPALACAALAGVLSPGGLVWLAPPLLAALAVAARHLPARAVLVRALAFAALLAVLCVPLVAGGTLLPPTSSPLTDDAARGNLIGPLEPAQVAGIWPAGDFRLEPVEEPLVAALIAVAIAAAAGGLWLAWRHRAWGVLAYAGGSLASAALIWALGSPWVDAKALATASAAIPFAAMLAGAWLLASGRPAAGGALVGLLALGVLWSNALAYRDVNLAPREQLAELERVGELVAGEGPALITEYQPYGVRHFLREADPEAVSELRRRRIPLRDGSIVPKGETADTDALDPGALALYRTLVLRRSPAQSRPPLPYRLVWQGEHYEVWQRPPGPPPVLDGHLGLGRAAEPTGRLSCARAEALAARAGPGGRLIAARRPPAVFVPLGRAAYPAAWARPSSPAHPVPRTGGSLSVTATVPAAGRYEAWLGGSLRAGATLLVDGRPAGEARHVLNNDGFYVRLGSVELDAGEHQLELRVGGADLHPGSGGAASAIGPLVLSRGGPGEAELVQVPATDARRLCGRSWDWVAVA